MTNREQLTFPSGDAAWLWLIAFSKKLRETSNRPPAPAVQTQLADDILRELDRLYRMRRVDLTQAKILRIWGERGSPPNPRSLSERNDARLWREAMVQLEERLVVRGIVVKEGPAKIQK